MRNSLSFDISLLTTIDSSRLSCRAIVVIPVSFDTSMCLSLLLLTEKALRVLTSPKISSSISQASHFREKSFLLLLMSSFASLFPKQLRFVSLLNIETSSFVSPVSPHIRAVNSVRFFRSSSLIAVFPQERSVSFDPSGKESLVMALHPSSSKDSS